MKKTIVSLLVLIFLIPTSRMKADIPLNTKIKLLVGIGCLALNGYILYDSNKEIHRTASLGIRGRAAGMCNGFLFINMIGSTLTLGSIGSICLGLGTYDLWTQS